MRDPIERQAAIDVLDKNHILGQGLLNDILDHIADEISALPSAQPEPAIPISWLMKGIERLESYENSFAVLDAMQLKALIKRWRGEQE